MMTDLIYRPEVENRLAYFYMTVSFFVACAALILGATETGGQIVWQSLILVALAVGILIGVRYILSYRTYSLCYMKGRHVLVVTDTIGRRISTVCHVYLDEVAESHIITQGSKKKLPLGENIANKRQQKFVFQNVYRPKMTVQLYVPENDHVRVIRLQTNDVFHAALQLRLETAKAERIADDEE